MVPRGGRDERPTPVLFGAAGWLFADLLLALAMLFLVANSVGTYPKPAPTPTPLPTATRAPTPPPAICGLNPHSITIMLTISNDGALRAGDSGAEAAFASEAKGQLAQYAGKVAGFVEVFGGSVGSISDGVNLANGAIGGLDMLARQGYIFSLDKTTFQALYGGDLQPNQVQLVIFFFKESNGTSCA